MAAIVAQHASAEFNAKVDEVLHRLAAAVLQALGANFVALILGGGYGRGEGAVTHAGQAECCAGAIELYPIVQHRHLVNASGFEAIRCVFESQLKTTIVFHPLQTVADVRRWRRRLQWIDLFNGHVVLAGQYSVVAMNAPKDLHRVVPRIEAARLLLACGAELLETMRMVRGVQPIDRADHVRRCWNRVMLAMGDAVLIVHRRYSSVLAQRRSAFESLEGECAAVAELGLNGSYASAIAYAMKPDAVTWPPPNWESLATLTEQWGRTLLYVEQRRMRRMFATMADYVAWRGIRERDINGLLRWPMNLAKNLCADRWSVRHPREEIYRQLPELLGLVNGEPTGWIVRSAELLDVWHGMEEKLL